MDSRAATILIVDDEEGIRELMAETLRLVGFIPITAGSGPDALLQLKNHVVDLVLLDINMPVMNGFDTLVKMREYDTSIPIIMLSARQEKSDVINGLKIGADDYVAKPFSIEEVVMRINAVLRRTRDQSENEVLRVGPIRLVLATYEVFFNEDKIELSKTEFKLLHYLMERPGRVIEKEAILRNVWGYDFETSTNVVDTYVSYLRRKLHRDGYEGIKTIRGIGFQIKDK